MAAPLRLRTGATEEVFNADADAMARRDSHTICSTMKSHDGAITGLCHAYRLRANSFNAARPLCVG